MSALAEKSPLVFSVYKTVRGINPGTGRDAPQFPAGPRRRDFYPGLTDWFVPRPLPRKRNLAPYGSLLL